MDEIKRWYNQQYYKKHREELLERAMRWRNEHPNYNREWYNRRKQAV